MLEERRVFPESCARRWFRAWRRFHHLLNNQQTFQSRKDSCCRSNRHSASNATDFEVHTRSTSWWRCCSNPIGFIVLVNAHLKAVVRAGCQALDHCRPACLLKLQGSHPGIGTRSARPCGRNAARNTGLAGKRLRKTYSSPDFPCLS